MERAIAGYHQDEEDDWVAELSCGHNQHVRHRPPFQLRPWVQTVDGRRGRLGTPIDCPLCDRAELPEGLRLARSSADWDERTMPKGLLRSHRLAGRTWGRLVVRQGRLRFTAATKPPIDVVLTAGCTQAVPPEVAHQVEPLGPVRFSIDFLAVDRPERTAPERASGSSPTDEAGLLSRDEVGRVADAAGPASSEGVDEGGDPACWAGLLCPECGAVLDGGSHRPGCPAGGSG